MRYRTVRQTRQVARLIRRHQFRLTLDKLHSQLRNHRRPDLLNKRLQILHKHLRHLPRREMPTVRMLLIPHKVTRSLNPRFRHWGKLLRVPRVPHRLLDVERFLVVEERRDRSEELTIWEDGAWERLRQPVQRDRIQELLDRGSLVSPGLQLFSDPTITSQY